jgi:hypothetical protein
MSGWRDLDGVRQPLPLDDWTTDRLLAGMVDPDDAPPGYAGLARALSSARGPVEAGELAGRDRIVAAVATAVAEASPPTPVSTPLRRRSMVSRLFGTKVAAAAMTTVLLATGAAAATGSLPGAVQDAANAVADRVGVTLPMGDPTDIVPASTQGKDAQTARDARLAEHDADEAPEAPADGSGDVVSDPVTDVPVAVDDDSENGTPASQEGVNAHIVRDLRNSDDPAADSTTDWKAVRDEFHAEHKAEHAPDPAPAADDARARRDGHLATVEQEKAERDALKDDDSDDVADNDSDDQGDDVADNDDSDHRGDDVADDDDADEDESGQGQGHEHDDEHEDVEDDAPAAS